MKEISSFASQTAVVPLDPVSPDQPRPDTSVFRAEPLMRNLS